jgi:hypothetical protein
MWYVDESLIILAIHPKAPRLPFITMATDFKFVSHSNISNINISKTGINSKVLFIH